MDILHRIHGGFRNCRARNLERKRRREPCGFGRGASGATKNIDPKSAPSPAPSDGLPEPEKKLDVISVWLALPSPPLAFLARRAIATKRDTRLGTSVSAVSRTKRDADFAV